MKDRVQKAFNHIKTLQGSSFGEHYCQSLNSYNDFEKDKNVIQQMLDNRLSKEEL